MVKSHHPNIYKLIDYLRTEQTTSHRKQLQIQARQIIQRTRYIDINDRLNNIKLQYDARLFTLLEYLSTISHNIY